LKKKIYGAPSKVRNARPTSVLLQLLVRDLKKAMHPNLGGQGIPLSLRWSGHVPEGCFPDRIGA
jgi:hypothetical protein